MTIKTHIQRSLALGVLAAFPLIAGASPSADPQESLGLLRYVRPTYPVLASSQGIFEGSAWVAVGWDEQGYARDVLVLRATHPAIGRAIEEAVAQWRRNPAVPHDRNENFILQFQAEGIVVVAMGSTNIPAGRELQGERVPRRGDLDAEPQVILQPMPSLAVRQAGTAHRGRVVVSFYVDEQGQVRAPNIVEASSEEFASATLEALRQWRYAPATVKGRPTIYFDHWAFDFSRR